MSSLPVVGEVNGEQARWNLGTDEIEEGDSKGFLYRIEADDHHSACYDVERSQYGDCAPHDCRV